MGFMKILRIVFIILIAFSYNNTIAQYSKSHYIPPITTTGNGAANPLDQYLYISTPSETPVNVVIKPMGGSDITGTVSNFFQTMTNFIHLQRARTVHQPIMLVESAQCGNSRARLRIRRGEIVK